MNSFHSIVSINDTDDSYRIELANIQENSKRIQENLDDIQTNLEIAKEKEAPEVLVNNTMNLVNELNDVLSQLLNVTSNDEVEVSELYERVRIITAKVFQLKRSMAKTGK